MLEDFNQNASKVTRDYTFELNEDGAPILTIFGGKLTTYRKLAEHALEKISKFLIFQIRVGQETKNYQEVIPIR